jgi:hypothetical protein
MQTFTVAAFRYWRLLIDMAAGSFPSNPPQVGVATLGRRLNFTLGPLPALDPYAEEATRDLHVNELGTFVGSNLQRIKKEFSISYGPPGMAVSEFFQVTPNFDTGFIPHARVNPFWFAWNYATDPREAYLCMVEGRISMPWVGSTARRELHMKLLGQKRVTVN